MKTKGMKQWAALVAAATMLCAPQAWAKDRPSQRPLLVIGASYAEGKTPFNGGVAPLGR